MNRFKNLMTVFAFSLLVLGVPTLASAQWRDRNRNDDDYNRNGNYNRNLDSTIKDLKNRSKSFAKNLDRELDNSRYDNSNREDRLLTLAKDFKDAANRLDDQYDNRNDYDNTQDEASRVLQLGQQLDNALYNSRLNYNVQGDWNQIQQDLDVLSNAYGYNNRNNRNNRNRNGNGSWRDRIPFPLPF
jgi:septal ring factor EnvC (AmiA/AmiB activator)